MAEYGPFRHTVDTTHDATAIATPEQGGGASTLEVVIISGVALALSGVELAGDVLIAAGQRLVQLQSTIHNYRKEHGR